MVLDESGFGMKVVLDENFGMKSAKFIPIWMKLYLTISLKTTLLLRVRLFVWCGFLHPCQSE